MDAKQGLGTSMGFLAMLAVALHIAVPTATRTSEGDNGKRPEANHATVGSGGAAALAGTANPLIEGPWLASQTFFQQEPGGAECATDGAAEGSATATACGSAADFTHLNQVESCANDAACSERLSRYFGVINQSGSRPHIQYIIATVPDPLHTRLALSTDTFIETIEKAAFNSHWEFAAQWLPWYDSADLGEKDPEKRRKQRAAVKEQESQPGLLVFRHGPVPNAASSTKCNRYKFDDEVLFVFLVGETPTAGINGVAFQKARAYMRALGDQRDVRIVGPSFSGSYYSLSRLIKADQLGSDGQTRQCARRGITYWVRTGSATNADAADAFKGTPHVRFNGTVENSSDHLENFKRVLKDLGIPPQQAAILSEDDTAFSQQFRDICAREEQTPKTLVLRFPRDISHLRNVYRTLETTTGEQKAAASVELSLKDAESGEDTVPIFSAAQTPIAQNSVVENIISEIRASRIRLVELAATNVLDALFLAGVLRERCPDTRLLIDEPNLLFVKAAQTEPLDGMLALSSYPLFSGSRLWSLDKTGGGHPIHESSGAEAVYNAISSFLLQPSSLANLNDYAWNGNHHPQTWLLELSRKGFAPVKLFANEDHSWYYNDPVDATGTFRVRGPSMLWFLITSALAVVSFALCAWIARLHRNRCLLIWSVAAPDGNHIADAYRLMFLFFALLILAVAQAILYIPLLCAAPPLSVTSFFRDKFIHLLAVAGIVLAFTFAIWLLKAIFAKPRVTAARYVYAALALAFALLIPVLWYICCTRSDGHRGFFLAMRAIEMHAGTSPALPILFLLAALFVFALGHLARLYFLISQRPRMFTAAVDRFSKGKLRNCRRAMNRILASPMDAKPRKQAALALALIAVFCLVDLLIGAHVKLSSNEGRLYDTITLSLLTLVLAAIGLTAAQIKRCWMALQQILVRLHALPLMCYFAQVHDAGKTGPIWVRRFNLQSLDIPTKSIIVLHNLRVALGNRLSFSTQLCSNEVATWFDNYREALGNLISARKTYFEGGIPREEPMDRHAIRKEFGRLRYLGAMISHHLNGCINIPEWTKSIVPWSPPAAVETAKAVKDCADVTEQRPSDFAQIFVALQYSMFINFGVRQIQNLLLTVSVGFALLVVALNVYAFEAPHFINRFLLVGFFVLGYIIWQVMSQMERDPILSRLSGTTEGALSRDFYVKVIGYAALPVVSLLSSQFPAIGHFLTSFVEPSLEAFK